MSVLLRALCALGLCIGITYMIFYTTNQNTAHDTLTVGIIIGYEPFAIVTSDGQLTGFDIDVAQEIGKLLGKQVVFQDMNLAGLLIALEQNKIDMILSSLSITQEREQAYTMIHYYGEPIRQFPLVFWNDTSKTLPSIRTIEELAQYTNEPIATEPGSAQEKLLLSNTRITTKQLNTAAEIILDLKYKKSYAALLDPEIVPTLQRQNKELAVKCIDVPAEYQSQGAGIALNKNNTVLRDQVANAIMLLKNNGTIARLETQWLKGKDNE